MRTLGVSTLRQQARLIKTDTHSPRLLGTVQAAHLGASRDM